MSYECVCVLHECKALIHVMNSYAVKCMVCPFILFYRKTAMVLKKKIGEKGEFPELTHK